jgi:hypothetical protein
MAKNNITISFSTDPKIAQRINKIKNEYNISRSALLTALLTMAIHSIDEEEGEKNAIQIIFNR